jgi:hypothetical protein
MRRLLTARTMVALGRRRVLFMHGMNPVVETPEDHFTRSRLQNAGDLLSGVQLQKTPSFESELARHHYTA